MKLQTADTKAYEKILSTFKKNKKGLTTADVAAGTGLPLNQLKTLLPLAADEYSARLEVTESGEILYSFPHGLKSRYRGFRPALAKFLSAFRRFGIQAAVLLFKAWIMVMLIGYFVLFITIAVASVFISMAGKNNRRGGGSYVSFGLFDLMIRLWFYSELMGTSRRTMQFDRNRRNKPRRPLHQAIFSFVFGDADPNKDHKTLERTEFIAYIRERRGVVSFPEVMALTGRTPEKAETLMRELCAEFGGNPEVTDEGTIVYRFDEILAVGKNQKQLSAAISHTAANMLSPLTKKLHVFSSNPQKMNFCFGLINGVNLLFGSYFLNSSFAIKGIVAQAAGMPAGALDITLQNSGIGGLVYYILNNAGINALPVMQIGLGIIPLAFSAVFWLIPAIRRMAMKRTNNAIRLDNFRGHFFSRIWASPIAFNPSNVNPSEDSCQPQNLTTARNQSLKEMGTYSMPEVSLDGEKTEVFAFPGLQTEKDALQKYRSSIDPAQALLGETVFDSGA